MATNNKVVVKFIADTAQMRKSLSSIDGTLKKFGKSALALGGVLAGAFAVKAITDFSAAAVSAASSFEETGSKIANIFGPGGSADLQEWASSSATAFGLSSQSALDAASTFGIYADKAGIAGTAQADFAKGLTELSSDLASFYDADQEQVINALSQGLRGETEALRRYGVFLDDAAYKQGYFAATGERVTGTLTAQQKIIGGQQQIWEQAGVAIGDFEATSDGLANTTRSLGAVLEDTKRKFGEGLLPVINELAQTLLPVLETLQPVIAQLGKDIGQALGPVLAELGKALGPIAQNFGVVAKTISGVLSIALAAIVPLLGPIADLMKVMFERVVPILNRVMEKLGVIVTKVVQALMPLLEVAYTLTAELLEGLEPAFDLIIEVLIILIDALMPVIKAVADFALALMPLVSAVLPLFLTGIKLVVMALDPVVKLLSVVLTKAIGYYIGALVKGMDAMRGFSTAVLRGLVKPLQIALGVVADFVEGFSSIPGIGGKFADAAKNIRGFAGGIEGSVESLLDTSKKVTEDLRGLSEGLINGLEETEPAVNGVLDTMTTIAPETKAKAVREGEAVGTAIGTAVGKGASSAKVTKENSTALSDSIKTSLEAATKVFEDWRGKVLGWLDLGSAYTQANNIDRAGIAEQIKALEEERAKLLAEGGDKARIRDIGAEMAALGEEAGTTWISLFTKQLTDATAFSAQLGQLAPLLNPVLLEQISGMGTEAGGAIATELINDPGGLIDTLNGQQAALEAAGVKLGEDIVNAAPVAGKDWGMSFLYDEDKGLVATINAQKKRVKRDIKKALDTSVEVRVVYNADYSNAGPAYNGSGISSSPVRQIRSYERLNGTSWRK